MFAKFTSSMFIRSIHTTAPRMAAGGSLKMWKSVSLFGVLPAVAVLSVIIMREHFSHHCIDRPPFVKYDYLRVRNKRFPWGDGNKTLFHNPDVNPLPDGYEDELED